MRYHYFFSFLLVSSLGLALSSNCFAMDTPTKERGSPKKKASRHSVGAKLSDLPLLRAFRFQKNSDDRDPSSEDSTRRGTMPVPRRSPSTSLDLRRRKSLQESPTVLKKFERVCKQRLRSYRGKTADQVLKMQVSDKDWYTRNFGKCYMALMLRESDPNAAKAHIENAHKDHFPAATFELAKMALKEGKLKEAQEYLGHTCEYTLSCQNEYDDQAHTELVNSIGAYVRKNPQLETGFERFKSHPLFKEKEKHDIVLDHNLISIYGEKPEEPTEGFALDSSDSDRPLRLSIAMRPTSQQTKEDDSSDSDPFSSWSGESSEPSDDN